MQRQSEVIARIYARLQRYRDASALVNSMTVARELSAEMPDVGMSERELAEMVAKYASHYGVALELDNNVDQ